MAGIDTSAKGQRKELPKKEADYDEEIKRLLKTGFGLKERTEYMNKFGSEKAVDDLYEKFITASNERKEKLIKHATKFAVLVLKRYGDEKYPLHKVLAKANKYKVKYGMSDDEFHEFKLIYDKLLAGATVDVKEVPRTRIGRVLETVQIESDGLVVGPKEVKVLEEIVRLFEITKPLHTFVTLQSSQYQSFALEAVNCDYDKTRHNIASHIHPLIAMLFLPKIKFLEDRILCSSIGRLLNAKKDKKPLNLFDYNLYRDYLIDPNDMVCNTELDAPIEDLKNRFTLQIKLWHQVLNLRSGRVYDGLDVTQSTMIDFLGTIDSCRTNTYDAPDYAYVRDEGTMLQKILATFAIRPTYIATAPMFGAISTSPYERATIVPKVTRIPMILVRLPQQGFAPVGAAPIVLDTSTLNHAQWYNDPNTRTMILRTQSVIMSENILVFYVNRRYHAVQIARIPQAKVERFSTDPVPLIPASPVIFSTTPSAITNFQNLNKTSVEFKFNTAIGTEQYVLRSVLAIDERPIISNLVAGCTAMFPQYTTLLPNVPAKAKMYDPLNVNDAKRCPYEDKPIDELSAIARTCGSIFLYEKA